MITKLKSIRQPGGLRRAGAAVATVLFAASLHGQQQLATAIATGLNEPNSVTSDPNNNIYITDASTTASSNSSP